MKALPYIIIGGSILVVGKYIQSLKRAEKQVVLTVTGKKESVTLQGVSVLIKYNIKNPTDAKLRMVAPLIKMMINNKVIASSSMSLIDIPTEVKDKSGKIIIRPFKETGEIQTRVLIPWLTLLTISPDIVKRFKSNEAKDKITINVETLSQVYTAVGSFPYKSNSIIKV
jgi:hypothetical protein